MLADVYAKSVLFAGTQVEIYERRQNDGSDTNLIAVAVNGAIVQMTAER